MTYYGLNGLSALGAKKKKQTAAQKKAAAAAKAKAKAKAAPAAITQAPRQTSALPTWLPWAIGGVGVLMVGAIAIVVLRR